MKKIILFTGLATLILSGCATSWVNGSVKYSPDVERNFLFEDTIVAIGETRETKELVLLGKNKTYLITSGGKRLAGLVSLDPVSIKINNDEAITLDLTSNGFSARINILYSPKTLTSDEYQALTSNGYQVNAYINGGGAYFTSSYIVNGKIFDKSEKDLASYNLSHGREIKVDYVSTKSNTSPGRPDKLITVPLAIAFDIVTSPLQMIILSNPSPSSRK